MFQPKTFAVVLLLIGGSTVRAQPAPLRAQPRPIILTGNPADPLPEVHGARGVAFTFFFDGLIREESIQVDTSRLRILDVGKRSLLIEPVTDLGAEERTHVRVGFVDGEPREAVFVLVAHPSKVDTWLEVIRRVPQPEVACPAQGGETRCGQQRPTAFRRSGVLGNRGVSVRTFDRSQSNPDGLESLGGVSFLEESWALVDVTIHNQSRQPWAPREGTLRSKARVHVGVRLVTAEHEPFAPGTQGRVWVETDVPPASAGEDFTLELLGVDGRSFTISNVKLPARTKEGKR